MKVYAILFLGMMLTCMMACKSGDGAGVSSNSVLPNGYAYTMHTNVGGVKPIPGQMITLDFELKGDDGTVIDNSRSPGNIPAIKLPPVDDENSKRNPMIAMVRQMCAGDSATIIVPIDSIPNLPPAHKNFKHIEYVIKTHTIEEEETYNARLQEEQMKRKAAASFKAEAAKKEIEPLYADYAAGKSSGKTRTLDNGLKITTLKEGTGAKPVNGDKVTVQYYGFLKDGSSFDNSFRAGRPFQFQVGQGMVIQGWDKGFLELKTGEKAFLEIPYDMAYGPNGKPPTIPAKADLIFYVELEKIN